MSASKFRNILIQLEGKTIKECQWQAICNIAEGFTALGFARVDNGGIVYSMFDEWKFAIE